MSVGRRADLGAMTVADNGPGVAPADRSLLFTPRFSRHQGGLGLGLFSAFAVLREHGGELVYEGGDAGAIFTMLLPQAS